MDDFRVGSVTSSDPFGRQPSGAIQRKREQQQDSDGRQPDEEAADTFEALASDDESEAEPIEDYYLPSDPSEAE